MQTQSASDAAPVPVWSARMIGWVTFLLGFPSGVALACINWLRMGQDGKVFRYAAFGLVWLVVMLVLAIVLDVSTFVFTVINIILVWYLYTVTKNDLIEFQQTRATKPANGWLGVGIAIGVLVGWFGMLLAFLLVQELVKEFLVNGGF